MNALIFSIAGLAVASSASAVDDPPAIKFISIHVANNPGCFAGSAGTTATNTSSDRKITAVFSSTIWPTFTRTLEPSQSSFLGCQITQTPGPTNEIRVTGAYYTNKK